MEDTEKITYDQEGVYEQEKQEILSKKHSILFEAVMPPIEPQDSKSVEVLSCNPLVAFKANGSYNVITKAMLLSTLQDYVEKELKDNPELAAAIGYLRLATLRHETVDFADVLKGDDNNDTAINT